MDEPDWDSDQNYWTWWVEYGTLTFRGFLLEYDNYPLNLGWYRSSTLLNSRPHYTILVAVL